jgi:hypothetical protein
MKKSELRKIIKEEVIQIIERNDYADKLSTMLVKSKKVKKGMSEKELIDVLAKQAKKDLGNQYKGYINDDDFIGDVLGDIKDKLK